MEYTKSHNAFVLIIALGFNIMDAKNKEMNTKSVNSYITARGNENLNIYSLDETFLGTVDGTEVESAYNVVAFRNDGVDEALTIAIPHRDETDSREESYFFRSAGEDSTIDLSIKYDNYYLSASAREQDGLIFSPNGSVEIRGATTDFNIELTANEGFYPTPWYHLSVSGESGKNPKVTIIDNGYILSGDYLEGVTVVAENNKTANILEFSTDEPQVLITQNGENLCVMSDTDKDGEYETVLITGTFTNHYDPSYGCFSINSISIALWGSLMIAGLLMSVTMLIGFSKKGSRRKR